MEPNHTSQRDKWRLWVICALALVSLPALFYGVEDWRGKRAWRGLVTELQSKGESIDPSSVIPPPAAPDDNVAETKIFWPIATSIKGAGISPLREVQLAPAGERPRLTRPNWTGGGVTDLATWQKFYAGRTDVPQPDQPGTPAEDVLRALSHHDMTLAELRAALSRPRARFPLDYPAGATMEVPHLAVSLRAGQVLQLRASANLASHRLEDALADSMTLFRLGDAFREEPILISWLTRAATTHLALTPLWEGLTQHQWQEEHLAAFASRLEGLDSLEHFQQALRGERNLFAIPTVQKSKIKVLSMTPYPRGRDWIKAAPYLPNGWYDQNRVKLVGVLQKMIESTDPSRGRIDAARVRAIPTTPANTPYTFAIANSRPQFDTACEKAAATQGRLHLARIAVALERHRLRHGFFPSTLGDLDAEFAPSKVGSLLDPATGHAAHYVLQKGDRYVLYYDGWNETDDGGKNGLEPFYSSSRYERPDLIWPQLQD